MQSSDANAKAQRTRSNSSTVRNDMQSSDANAKAQRTAATKKNLERHPAPDLPFYSIRCACIHECRYISPDLHSEIRPLSLPFLRAPFFRKVKCTWRRKPAL